MAETGARSAELLERMLTSGRKPHKAYRQLPFLIPTTAGCTTQEPAESLFAELDNLDRPPLVSLSFACGFGPADIHDCGPSVVAYGEDATATDAAADALAEAALAREAAFAAKFWDPAEAVAHAIAAARVAKGPVILADTQDNPGGGANGDTVGILEELVRQGAEGAVVGLIYDPEAAAAAQEVGEGGRLHIGLGAKSGLPGHRPFEADYQVARLGDGAFTATGPFYEGAQMRLGPMALLTVGSVRVAVASRKNQAADQEMFRHLGVEPAETEILVLKSSVHFRAHFEPIAAEVLVVAAPGPNPADLSALTYRRLRSGVRRG